MKKITRNTFKFAVALVVLLAMFGAGLNATPAYAASCTPTNTVSLFAKKGTAMVGGNSVNIYGFSANAGDPAGLPGPQLSAAAGDCVQVTLTNVDIPVNVSLVFQGQELVPDTVGVPQGGSTSYTFSVSPGTFLYEAGLTPNGQHLVAMGLYGALIVSPAAAGQAYDDASTAYDQEAIMVLSELDPVLNNSSSPADVDIRNYKPQYFLINGKTFPDTDPITGNPGEKYLFRYINAGLQAHSMSTLGFSQTIIAQDGQPYLYSHQVVAETIATGQTLDTLVTVPVSAVEGNQFAVFDANMMLRNGAKQPGGMLTFLTVGNGAPPPPADSGPAVSGLSLTPNPTNGSVDVTVSTTVTDGGTNPTNVHAAEYYIDGTANPATALAGSFDTATSITVTGTINAATLAALPSGNHTIYVRGQDSNLNWGPFASVTLNLDKTGPRTTGLSLTPNPSNGAVSVALAATGDDTATGGSNVTAAEYWVDAGAPAAMNIVAGADAPIRNFTATIPAGLSMGAHVVSVRSQDAFGNWGAVATITLQIADTAAPTTQNVLALPNPTNGLVGFNTSVPAVRVTADFSDVGTGGSNLATAEGFIDTIGTTGTGFVFIANDGVFNSPAESGYADIPLASIRALSDGSHTIYVHAKDASGNWGDPNQATTVLVVDKTGPTFGPVSISPAGTTRGGGTVNVTITGSITTLSDLNFSSGAYTLTDSKSPNVVNGTFAINANGSFSFSTDISRSNNGQNSVSNRRIYTFTLSATDTLGNVGTTTVTFWVQ